MTEGAGADLVTALGLVFVIEGLLLTVAPDRLKRFVAEILDRPAAPLRVAGLLAAAFGVFLVWLVRG